MLTKALSAVVAAVSWVFTRRAVAAALMTSGVAAATSGAYLQWGLGVGLLVAAGLLIPLSLLVGWE